MIDHAKSFPALPSSGFLSFRKPHDSGPEIRKRVIAKRDLFLT
jgi:hypothetical protein